MSPASLPASKTQRYMPRTCPRYGRRERQRQSGSKIHQSVTNHLPTDLDGPRARRTPRSLARWRASRSPFAVGGPPKIRMPPPRRRASERATKTTKKEEERERRSARYTTTPSTRRRPLFAILIGRYGGAKRGGAVAPCPKNDMKHLDGSEVSWGAEPPRASGDMPLSFFVSRSIYISGPTSRGREGQGAKGEHFRHENSFIP